MSDQYLRAGKQAAHGLCSSSAPRPLPKPALHLRAPRQDIVNLNGRNGRNPFAAMPAFGFDSNSAALLRRLRSGIAAAGRTWGLQDVRRFRSGPVPALQERIPRTRPPASERLFASMSDLRGRAVLRRRLAGSSHPTCHEIRPASSCSTARGRDGAAPQKAGASRRRQARQLPRGGRSGRERLMMHMMGWALAQPIMPRQRD